MRETSGTLFTEAEVAARLRVVPRTLKMWRQLGQGPPFLKLGRMVRYSVADLNDWLATCVRMPITAQQADERRRLRNARRRAEYAEASAQAKVAH